MTDPENQPQQPETAVSSQGPRTIRLEDLLQGQRDIQIMHGDRAYRLRLTRNGKLILTK
jgi:hemin uptake protein HemP